MSRRLGPTNRRPDIEPSTGRAAEQSGDRFMGVSLRGWAISSISLIAVLTAMGVGFFTVYAKYKDLDTEVTIKSQENGALAALNDRLSKQLQPVKIDTEQKLSEAQRHIKAKDHYDTFPIDQDPEIVKAEYYPSDGCIHIVRSLPPGKISTSTKKSKDKVYYGSNIQDSWIPDPSRSVALLSTPELEPSFKVSDSKVKQASSKESTKQVLETPHMLEVSIPKLKKAGMFQGSCMNPHPGQFQIRNQQMTACDVQVWRYFPDGCTHYQMYNACNGIWTSAPIWTSCAIRHGW